jgi:hypothetical protein
MRRFEGDAVSWRQPWDVVCPRCKAGKGRVCRAPYSNKSLEDKAHGPRWDLSLGLRNPLGPPRSPRTPTPPLGAGK